MDRVRPTGCQPPPAGSCALARKDTRPALSPLCHSASRRHARRSPPSARLACVRRAHLHALQKQARAVGSRRHHDGCRACWMAWKSFL
eukprot:scaffold39869_cov32-Tisochrysis_lutea.AAC.2